MSAQHGAGPYINQWGIEVVGFESAMGGLYKSEAIASEISEGVGPYHAVVRFVDVVDAYEAIEHILKFDAKGLGAIGESLARSALRNSTRPAAKTIGMCRPGQRFRVKWFLSRLGEDRYTVECSNNGKPWFALRGPNGRVRAFQSEAAANAAIAKATGNAA